MFLNTRSTYIISSSLEIINHSLIDKSFNVKTIDIFFPLIRRQYRWSCANAKPRRSRTRFRETRCTGHWSDYVKLLATFGVRKRDAHPGDEVILRWNCIKSMKYDWAYRRAGRIITPIHRVVTTVTWSA